MASIIKNCLKFSNAYMLRPFPSFRIGKFRKILHFVNINFKSTNHKQENANYTINQNLV